MISLPGPGRKAITPELLDPVELVLGDLDAVELEDPGDWSSRSTSTVSTNPVSSPRSGLIASMVDGRLGRLPPVVVSVLCDEYRRPA